MQATSLGTNSRVNGNITLYKSPDFKYYLKKVAQVGTFTMAVMYVLFTQFQMKDLKLENAELKQDLRVVSSELSKTQAEHDSVVSELQDNIIKANKTISTLNNSNEQLITDNQNLASEYDEVKSAYDTLYKRKELFDKYEYVVMYGGNRTDVTYDQLEVGEEIMIENNYDPNILFSTIMVESSGKASAKNSVSTATGYGQFLKATGKYTYESLMGKGKGTYHHSMAFNGDLNIKMTATYLTHLLDIYDGSLFRAMKNYSGKDSSGTSTYIGWMNSHSSKVGVNMFRVAGR